MMIARPGQSGHWRYDEPSEGGASIKNKFQVVACGELLVIFMRQNRLPREILFACWLAVTDNTEDSHRHPAKSYGVRVQSAGHGLGRDPQYSQKAAIMTVFRAFN